MRTAIIGLLVLSSGAAGLACGEDASYEKTLPADPRGVVEISNFAGTTEVSGWDKSEVEVRANIESGVDRITAESDHGHIAIRVMLTHHGGGATLKVRIPRQSELDVTGVSSDITTTDVEGELMLKTVSGRIKADVFQKDVEAKSVSGDVILRGRGKNAGAAGIHVSSISGSIRVDRAGGDLEATNVSADMSLRLDHPAHDVRIHSTSGNVTFEGTLAKGGSLEAQTVSGNLSVHSGHDGPLDYEVNTFSGEIRNCMDVEAERVSRYAPGKRLAGSRGGTDPGEARLRLKSMSGNVELCDKT